MLYHWLAYNDYVYNVTVYLGSRHFLLDSYFTGLFAFSVRLDIHEALATRFGITWLVIVFN